MRIATEYAATLKDAGPEDVTQHSEEYKISTTYELRFNPTAVVRAVNHNAAKVKILLTYPKQVTPQLDEDDNINNVEDYEDDEERSSKWRVKKNCDLYQDGVIRTEARCYVYKEEFGRLIEIYDALTTEGDGFSGVVTLKIRFQNPKDNWDDVGFKLRTYEMAGGNTALVDKLEADVLIPLLQCQAPCEECLRDGDLKKLSVGDDGPAYADGFITVPKFARDYCTKCWTGDNTVEPKIPARP